HAADGVTVQPHHRPDRRRKNPRVHRRVKYGDSAAGDCGELQQLQRHRACCQAIRRADSRSTRNTTLHAEP
ncbi:unnamed protein product, partial [Closterium sp. NIES-53]